MSEAGDDPQERLTQSADERIFGLLALAEDQQTAVRAGVEGMALERADRKSTRLNSSHPRLSRMPSSA